jgi:hypothetical protein
MYVVWQRIEGKSSDGGHNAECHSVTAQDAIVSHLVLHRRKEARGETSITPLTRALSEPLETVGCLFVHALSMAHNRSVWGRWWTLTALACSTNELQHY